MHKPNNMYLIFTILFFISINAELGNHTGSHPWYWKPTRRPKEKSEISNEYRFKREDIDWLAEIEKRKNQSGTTPHPPVTTAPPINDQCPTDVIHDIYAGKGYFFSWEDRRTNKLKMDWVQAVNFCRARCLEPVSIETIREHQFLAKHILRSKIRGVWTSGRKCDFPGCEHRPEVQPADIYGWYWEGSRLLLPPTTDRFDVLWSNTGPHGKPQPDNSEGKKGGESESCLAVLNNVYKDGVAWHDERCSKRKPFICEQGDQYRGVEVKVSEDVPHHFEHHLIER